MAATDVALTSHFEGIEKGFTKGATYGTQFFFMTMGARWAMSPETTHAFRTMGEKAYIKTWKASPKVVKQIGYDLKTGYGTLRFKYAQITGKGLYYPGEVGEPYPYYLTGRWTDPMPRIYTTSKDVQIFKRIIPTEKPGRGIILEYQQMGKPELYIHEEWSVIPKKIISLGEYRGTGTRFQPDIPGEYWVGGKKVFIGATEAYDIFTGKYRPPGVPWEKASTMYHEGKLQLIPDVKIQYGKITLKPSGEFYKYVSFGKKFPDIIPTRFTMGVGKTENVFTILSKFKGHKLVVSRFGTTGTTQLSGQPVIDRYGNIRIGGEPILFKGKGTIVDLTGWYGASGEMGAQVDVSQFSSLVFQKIKIPAPPKFQMVSKGVFKPAGVSIKPPSVSQQFPVTEPVGVSTQIYQQPVPVVMPPVVDVATMLDMQKTFSKYFTKTVTIPVTELISKSVTKQITEPITELITIPITKQITEPITELITMPITKQITEPITKQITEPITKQITEPITKQITEPITKQITEPITKQITMPISMPITRPIAFKFDFPTPPVIIPPLAFVFPPKQLDMFGIIPGQGYDVYVKERQYFKGKKQKEGKFIKLSKKPLSQLDALALGGAAIDESAAASFMIKPSEGQAQPLDIKIDPWKNIEHKFYSKDNNVRVEQTAHRIDQPGEVKGISALGWYAEKRKIARTQKRLRKTRPADELVVFDIDVFEDMFKMPDMNKVMNNMFKKRW